jgi:pimeloyl-ACP methyl ester carboxylesterase
MNAPVVPTDTDPAAIVADFERRARRFETPCGDGTIVWRAWGSGPPVVLFHGAQGAWSHWIRNIDALAQDRTVWTADLPGCGDSAMPPSEDHAGISEVLAAGLRQLFPAQLPVDIVGFSLGGVIGANLAVLQPDVVRRVVLVATGGLATPQGHVKLKRVRGLKGEERRAQLRANLLSLMIHDPANVDELAMHLQVSSGFKGRLDVVHLVLPDKLLLALPKVTVQVDAIWGDKDQPHPTPAVQEAVLRGIHPDLDFRVIANSGHWVMYEQATAFNRILRELLARPLRTKPARS